VHQRDPTLGNPRDWYEGLVGQVEADPRRVAVEQGLKAAARLLDPSQLPHDLLQKRQPMLLGAYALLEDGQAVGRVRHEVGRRQVRDHAVTVLPAQRTTPPTPGSTTRTKDTRGVAPSPPAPRQGAAATWCGSPR
jgi:hypothetical protein